VWDPVAARVGGATRVFVVPDGVLHSINLGALPAPNRKFLVELDPLVQLLTAERDLVAKRAPPAGPGAVLALGGPAFDDALVLQESEGRTEALLASLGTADVAATEGPVYRGPHSSCTDFRSLRFAALPAAGGEAGDVTRTWTQGGVNVLELTGSKASEAAFRRFAPGRRVVHLATHGIYLGTECPATAGASALRQSPLLRSGVALAGANHRDAETAGDDGILTAEEIGSLDLAAAEWVVLSGCETGRGEIADDEGVLGMRRAFQVAGARTTIMSLWPVDDVATREWMKALHRAGRDHGLDASRATRDAARAVLEARRSKGLSTHPATWGAFVAAGP
jgi:CHAT domain-containing protein